MTSNTLKEKVNLSPAFSRIPNHECHTKNSGDDTRTDAATMNPNESLVEYNQPGNTTLHSNSETILELPIPKHVNKKSSTRKLKPAK